MNEIRIGDKRKITLKDGREFNVTLHKIEGDMGLWLFDECVARRHMNEVDSTEGGWELSDLKCWIDTELFYLFPDAMRENIRDLTIPTMGQIYGQYDTRVKFEFDPDGDDQLPLMRERWEFRFCSCTYWLRNVSRNRHGFGCAGCGDYSTMYSPSYCGPDTMRSNENLINGGISLGVRPEFWYKL